MSARRIIVERPIADEFTSRLAEKTAGLKLGDPKEMDTIIGPLINDDAVATVRRRVEEAVAAGAKVLAGGEAVGPCFQATLLADVPASTELAQQETFGPVATIEVVDSPEAAVERANATSYGLSSGIITTDPDRGIALAQQLEAGIVHVNDQPVGDEPQMPFGGVKDTGCGRFGGQAVDRRVHRAALDHRPERNPALPVLADGRARHASRSRRGAGPRRPDRGPGGLHAPDPVRRRARGRAPGPPRADADPDDARSDLRPADRRGLRAEARLLLGRQPGRRVAAPLPRRRRARVAGAARAARSTRTPGWRRRGRPAPPTCRSGCCAGTRGRISRLGRAWRRSSARSRARSWRRCPRCGRTSGSSTRSRPTGAATSSSGESRACRRRSCSRRRGRS